MTSSGALPSGEEFRRSREQPLVRIALSRVVSRGAGVEIERDDLPPCVDVDSEILRSRQIELSSLPFHRPFVSGGRA